MGLLQPELRKNHLLLMLVPCYHQLRITILVHHSGPATVIGRAVSTLIKKTARRPVIDVDNLAANSLLRLLHTVILATSNSRTNLSPY